LGIAKRIYSPIGGYQPITQAVGGSGHTNYRLAERDVGRGALELRVAKSVNASG